MIPEDLTLRLETDSGPKDVTIQLDFTDLSADELNRARELSDMDPRLAVVSVVFVSVARQIELDDADFPAFATALLPLFDGDGSNIIMEGAA